MRAINVTITTGQQLLIGNIEYELYISLPTHLFKPMDCAIKNKLAVLY